MADAPFTVVDDAVLAALTSWAPLTAIVSATRITMADRSVDVRSPTLADIFKSIRVEPNGWATANGVVRYTGADTKQVLKYRVIIETAGLDLATCRSIEYEVFRALTSMFETRNLLTDPAPWLYENKWDLGPATQEPYPTVDPDRWVTRIDVGVALTAPIATLLSSTATVTPLSAVYLSDGVEAAVIVRFSAPLTDSTLTTTAWTFTKILDFDCSAVHVWNSVYVVLTVANALGTGTTLKYTGTNLLDFVGTAVPGFTGLAVTAM